MDANESERAAAETRRAKEVEFFAASVNAWYNTALEHDKSIFALSAGGIALLVTLLTTVGVSSVMMLVLYVLAIACFVLCLIAILLVFGGNRKHIEQVVNRTVTEPDAKLAKLDIAAMMLFGSGVVLAAAIGVTVAYNSYVKESNMANEKQPSARTGPTMTYDSVSGMTNLTKSFNGISTLQQTVTPTPATPTQPSAAPATPPAATGGTTTPANPNRQ